MDKDFMRRWIEALRSGKYKQLFGTYRGYESYCAVGLAAYVILPQEAPIPVLTAERMIGNKLTDDVIEWNDKDHLTFSDIADRLEARMETET